jgi:hypothetical protein
MTLLPSRVQVLGMVVVVAALVALALVRACGNAGPL